MSFTKEDILARLQNGETAEDIALEVANAINEAEAEKKALDAEKVAKEKEEARVLDAKRVAVDNMLDAVCDYFVASGEGDLITDIKDIEIDKVIEMLDGSIEMAKSLEKLKGLEFVKMPVGLKFPRDEHKCGSGDCGCSKPEGFTVKAKVNPDADAIIKAFLKNI